MAKFIIKNKKTADEVITYFVNKIKIEDFEKALRDTIKMDNGVHTQDEIYDSVVGSILNCAVEYCEENLKSYVVTSMKNRFNNIIL